MGVGRNSLAFKSTPRRNFKHLNTVNERVDYVAKSGLRAYAAQQTCKLAEKLLFNSVFRFRRSFVAKLVPASTARVLSSASIQGLCNNIRQQRNEIPG